MLLVVGALAFCVWVLQHELGAVMLGGSSLRHGNKLPHEVCELAEIARDILGGVNRTIWLSWHGRMFWCALSYSESQCVARLLHPSWCRERVLSMIKFLGDETGTDKKPTTRISAIGGLVGTEKAWGKFDTAWNKVLKAEDIPFFHAVQCEKGTGEFYGLDVAKRGHFMDRLLEVILNAQLQPCAYGVVVPHFNAMSLEFRAHYTDGHPDVPYYVCLHYTFVEGSHTADSFLKDEQVYFLFEQQDEFEASAKESFAAFKQNSAWPNSARLGGEPIFVKNEEAPKYPGLQAADLLAYEMYRHLDNRHFQPVLKPEWKVRTAFKILQRKMKDRARYFDSDGLARLEAE
jgi:hypothetical protein